MITKNFSQQAIKIGTCPHGLPQGVCPVCSGLGGGGSAKSKDSRQRAGEMSWNECYAIGQRMKAAKEKELLRKQDLEPRNPFLNNKLINVVVRNFIALQNKIHNLLIPIIQIFAKPAKFMATNVFQAFIVQAKTVLKNLKETVINISDKLAAIFGEKETAIREKLSDTFKKLKKKVFSFFEMVDASMSQGEDEEDKINQFEQLKKKLSKIYQEEDDVDIFR